MNLCPHSFTPPQWFPLLARGIGVAAARALLAEVALYGRQVHALLRPHLVTDTTMAQLRAALAQSGIAMQHLQAVAPTLEDVFVATTSIVV